MIHKTSMTEIHKQLDKAAVSKGLACWIKVRAILDLLNTGVHYLAKIYTPCPRVTVFLNINIDKLGLSIDLTLELTAKDFIFITSTSEIKLQPKALTFDLRKPMHSFATHAYSKRRTRF